MLLLRPLPIPLAQRSLTVNETPADYRPIDPPPVVPLRVIDKADGLSTLSALVVTNSFPYFVRCGPQITLISPIHAFHYELDRTQTTFHNPPLSSLPSTESSFLCIGIFFSRLLVTP